MTETSLAPMVLMSPVTSFNQTVHSSGPQPGRCTSSSSPRRQPSTRQTAQNCLDTALTLRFIMQSDEKRSTSSPEEADSQDQVLSFMSSVNLNMFLRKLRGKNGINKCLITKKLIHAVNDTHSVSFISPILFLNNLDSDRRQSKPLRNNWSEFGFSSWWVLPTNCGFSSEI